MPDTRPILLIEDDRVDVMTVERALKQLKVPNQLIRTTNGEQALEYLKNENNELPCVILMDLNMPKMNGMEFLQIIRTQDFLKFIPIVVMSTSNERQDMNDAAKFGIVKYLVKSLGYEKFVEALSTIEQLWSSPELSAARQNPAEQKTEKLARPSTGGPAH
jgi:CheY-like chemotaxis protein